MSKVEVETRGVQVSRIPRHVYDRRGNDEGGHIAQHQQGVDEEPPVGDAEHILPGNLA